MIMTERERFEAWAESQYMSVTESYIEGVTVTYRTETTEAAWRAWQARCPDEWQCVPRMPTNTMEDILKARGSQPYIAWCFALEAAPHPGEES